MSSFTLIKLELFFVSIDNELWITLQHKETQIIEYNRKLINQISTWALLIKLLELVPESKKYYILTNQKYSYRLLKRNSFSFRTKTHQSQIFP